MRVNLPPSVLVGLSLIACAHSGPRWDSAAGRLCADHGCYRVGALGKSWQLLRVGESEIAFHDPKLGAIIQANSSCRDDAEATPLRTLTEHLLIGYTERTVRSETKAPLAEREALRTIIDAKLDGVPIVLDLYVLKRNGCIFNLSYAAPPDRYEEGTADFARFVNGFHDERRL